MIFLTRFRYLSILDDFTKSFVIEGDDCIFWLQIRVDNLADPMQIIKSDQNLLGNSSHEWHRNSFVIIPFHYFEKIDTQNFKNHNKMVSIGAIMHERIEQLNDLSMLTRKLPIGLRHCLFKIIFVIMG